MKVIISALALILCLGVSTSGFAEEGPWQKYSAGTLKTIETWECKATYGTDILVVAYVNEGRTTGRIKVAGVEHDTIFRIDGFNRRWDFDNYNYSFIIKPDGRALYYDFSSVEEGEKTTASQVMQCKMKQ